MISDVSAEVQVKKIDNDTLRQYHERKKINYIIQEHYIKLESVKSTKDDSYYMFKTQFDRLYNSKSYQIGTCMTYWDVNIYNENKTIEILKTFRCKDKFCPNCKRVRVAEYLQQFMPYFKKYSEKYIPMLLTLTVPNVEGNNLSATIDKLFESFYYLNRLYYDKITTKRAYKNRCFDIMGAFRALETTHNNYENTFHPHIHAIVFIEKHNDCLDEYFEKNIRGEYNNKTGAYNLISPADIEIRNHWTKLYNKIDRRVKYIPCGNYMCDIRPIDGIKGILEVLKYSFKSKDIIDYDVFLNLYNSLHGKRAKQGYGCLYNIKAEDDEIIDVTENLFDEIPNSTTVLLKDLFGKYGDYEKIKRFRKIDFIHMIDKYLED